MELMYQFFLAYTYLLVFAPNVPSFDHFYTATLLTYECGYKNNIDPLLGAIIVQHESGGKKYVVNKEGNDTGLMQIQPPYAYNPSIYAKYEKGYIAGCKDATKKIKKSRYSQDELKQPHINIKLGCWFLAMWKKGKWSKTPEWYIAHYASGSKLKPKGKRFQNWVLKRDKKWKKTIKAIYDINNKKLAQSTSFLFTPIF